jgi:hypothetical protein
VRATVDDSQAWEANVAFARPHAPIETTAAACQKPRPHHESRRTVMTTNKKDIGSEKKGRVKIGKLQVNKETVKDLTDKEAEQIKGGNPTQPTQVNGFGCKKV